MNPLYREIREQPARVADCLNGNAAAAEQFADAMRRRGIRSFTFAARGTSYHAALYALYLLGSRNVPAHLFNLDLDTFLHRQPFLPQTCLVGISQSGASPDIGQIMRRARAADVPTLAVTNKPQSPFARQAEHVMDILAGPEVAVAATKSYVNQLVSVALLSQSWAPDAGLKAALARLPDALEGAFALEAEIRDLALTLSQRRNLLVVGRGFNHVTACETALKLQELTYTHAMSFTSADFLHGPIALLDKDAAILCLDAGQQDNPHFQDIEEKADQTGACLLVLTDAPNRWTHATHLLSLPSATQTLGCLRPMVHIAVCQLLAMHVGLVKGLDVTQPRYLVKETLTG